MKIKHFLPLLLLLGSNEMLTAQEIALTPQPAHLTVKDGRFEFGNQLKAKVTPYQGDSIRMVFESFKKELQEATGIKVSSTQKEAKARIILDLNPQLPAEAYKLNVSKKQVRIEASRPAGFYYALQTLKQLMPRNVMAGVATSDHSQWSLPSVEIEDAPRFEWRGFMLDEGRHFFGKDEIKRVIDMMAIYKMNRFHWHLTEDQGWRIEIKKYPKLTETGAWRNSKVLAYGDVKPDGERYGGFYTQKDIKEIVAYAKKKFIEIIPEIDIPGHSQAAVAAYPEFLACDPENKHEVWLRQGISTDVINVANPKAMQFAKDVIDELTELFPFNYIHLGGDECPTNKWQKNDECKKLLSEIGSSNFRDLQIYFYKQLKDYIATKPADQQRQLIFWNEVLHGNTSILGNDITIMAWIGANAAAKQAAKQGMNTILSPQIPYYINRKQSKLPTEPMSQGHGTETVEAVYNYQPLKDVDAALQPYYKGVQANFWTEWVTEPSVLEYLMLPRLAAVAEAGWTPQEKRNYEDFKERIRKDAELYDLKGWNYGKHIMK
ncbi:beta-N-acetylhexosaminidase [Bacteroides thetaiotaomicron]|uniref:beta-N-acetylhexosaminidase n=1 Tax=Bacteroides thetaiotaomicron TaxID=818 RepID=A0A6I0S4N6_BACT4|nr:beta-N-acetylhexosaminidase [Bacteroides thetaiotaomicron]KAB4460243.1 beta-N-acetylhexosaminidase [Bacteroides thetaiotaomicron]KAB4461943.1 beta-N-acetylhexosaminidase [Bacteroides thetaiotaomicron]KAB4471180.1 beta-N-acetylhexosaminidase [Bacteroides thetaiotaomicron]KAB4471235.1 beta-N-acetylhexosaminidase [Bacteroides thetaiotaomicron]KAB4482621.1 beta-N-acetylhexosaminidase [Bacteroides thetaiotaomicron]